MTDQEKRILFGIIDDAEKAIEILQSVKRRAALMLNPQQSTKPISIKNHQTGKTVRVRAKP